MMKKDPLNAFYDPIPEEIERDINKEAKEIFKKLRKGAIAEQMEIPDEVA